MSAHEVTLFSTMPCIITSTAFDDPAIEPNTAPRTQRDGSPFDVALSEPPFGVVPKEPLPLDAVPNGPPEHAVPNGPPEEDEEDDALFLFQV